MHNFLRQDLEDFHTASAAQVNLRSHFGTRTSQSQGDSWTIVSDIYASVPKIMEDRGRQARILQPERSCGDENIRNKELCTESKIEAQKKKKPEFCYKTDFPAKKKASISKR